MLTKSRVTILVVLMLGAIGLILLPKTENLPLVAIANYGPHASLDASIQGIQDALASKGFIDHKTVRYEIQDVGFDASMIPQMIATLKNHHPQVMLVLTTPVAQFAKGSIKDIPLVYDVITDPIEAGLIKEKHQADANMTGSSDKQNLDLLLRFAKQLMPDAHTIGLLYAPSEANDVALLQALKKAASAAHMDVLARPVGESREIPAVMQQMKHKADLIYVGASGPVLPALPVISSLSQTMRIPVLSVDDSSVKEGIVLASFGVDYHQVGVHAGELAAQILQHPNAPLPHPVDPTVDDHHGFIHMKQARLFELSIPASLAHVTRVE